MSASRSQAQLLIEAREWVRQTGKTSTSAMANALGIGWRAAAQLAGSLEMEELVSAADADGRRELGLPKTGARRASARRGHEPRHMDEVAITTERLILRSWRSDDIEPYDRFCNTPEVMSYLGGVQSREQLLEDIIYFMECDRDGCTFWAVERRDDGELLGFCGLVDVLDDGPVKGELEIGWRVRADRWRRGYAEEAARATLDFAFDELGAEYVISRARADNEPSLSLMAKLGMRHRPELDYISSGSGAALAVYKLDALDNGEGS